MERTITNFLQAIMEYNNNTFDSPFLLKNMFNIFCSDQSEQNMLQVLIIPAYLDILDKLLMSLLVDFLFDLQNIN